MITFFPLPGGHIMLAERFVDRAFSFTLGWNYWYCWNFLLPAELSASAVLIDFWDKDVNNAVWITMCLAVVFSINMCGAGVYGEAEFIFEYRPFFYTLFYHTHSIVRPTVRSRLLRLQVQTSTFIERTSFLLTFLSSSHSRNRARSWRRSES